MFSRCTSKLTALFTACSLLAGQAYVFAEDLDVPPPPRDQSLWQTVAMLGIVVAFLYIIVWRPEQKRRKELEQQRSSLKQGDRVVAAGIIGHVLRVKDETVILKMYDGAKVEFLKAAISDILPEAEDKKDDKAGKEV